MLRESSATLLYPPWYLGTTLLIPQQTHAYFIDILRQLSNEVNCDRYRYVPVSRVKPVENRKYLWQNIHNATVLDNRKCLNGLWVISRIRFSIKISLWKSPHPNLNGRSMSTHAHVIIFCIKTEIRRIKPVLLCRGPQFAVVYLQKHGKVCDLNQQKYPNFKCEYLFFWIFSWIRSGPDKGPRVLFNNIITWIYYSIQNRWMYEYFDILMNRLWTYKYELLIYCQNVILR